MGVARCAGAHGIGPRDAQSNSVVLVRRDNRVKEIVSVEALEARLPVLLEEIQQALRQRALEFREQHTYRTDNYEAFKHTIPEHPRFLPAKSPANTPAQLPVQSKT